MAIPQPNPAPYYTKRTPRGSVVICGRHLVTDEVKEKEAEAIAAALNEQHRRTMCPT